MKVKQLIDELNDYDQEDEVLVAVLRDGISSVYSPEELEGACQNGSSVQLTVDTRNPDPTGHALLLSEDVDGVRLAFGQCLKMLHKFHDEAFDREDADTMIEIEKIDSDVADLLKTIEKRRVFE